MSISLKIASILLPAVLFAGCTQSNSPASPTSSITGVTASTIPTTTSTTSYTPAQVATHNSASNCWLIIDNKVYDVTQYAPNHPGGNQILSGCGQDMSSYMANSHKPVDNQLPQFQIGTLKP